MEPPVGRLACDCCKDICKQAFQKIVELNDAGAAIYRYVPQTGDIKLINTEAQEIFVLRNIGNEDLKLEDCIMELGNANISCPRCVKIIEHAKKLFKNIHKDIIRDVKSVCDHCYMRQRLHCPCCEKIVDKFLTFCTDDAQPRGKQRQSVKSKLPKTEQFLKRTFLNLQGNLLEPRAQSEDRLRAMRPTVTSGDQSRILSARSIRSKKHVSKFSSFLKIAKEIIVKDETKGLTNIKRAEEQKVESPLKVASFLDLSQELKSMKKSESSSVLKLAKKVVVEDEGERLKNKYGTLKRAEDDTIEIPLRMVTISDISEESEPLKARPKSIRLSILKSHKGAGVPEDIIVPYEKMKRSVSPSKSYSFETVFKSPNKVDLSNFEYTFPKENRFSTKPANARVSSSELIKITQEGLQERAEAKKTEREKLNKRREEEKLKKNEREQMPKIEAQKKLLDEIPQIANKAKEYLQEGKERNKVEIKNKELGEKNTEAEQNTEEKEKLVTTDKESKRSIVSSKVDGVENIGKSEQKGKLEKAHDISATIDLKQKLAKGAKAEYAEEKNRKNQEKTRELAEKKARQAGNIMENTQQSLSQKPIVVDSDVEPKIEKSHEKVKQPEQKARVEKKRDIAATANLKQQLAKEAKAELEEEKNINKKEKDQELAEKKAKQAETNMEDSQQPLSLKQSKQMVLNSDFEPKVDKTHEKVKEPEPKAKLEKTQNIAATTDLILQLAKQGKAELEAEKRRKQLEKEKEMAEQKYKLAAKAVFESEITPPNLSSVSDAFSSFGDISEMITKPDEVRDIIIKDEICDMSDKKCAYRQVFEVNPKKAEKTPKQLKIHKIERQPTNGRILELLQPAAITTENKNKLPPDPEASKGVIRYALSDSTFIEKGWTMLPTEKVVRKMNVYRMRPAKPEFDWFEHHKNKRVMKYDTGELLAEFNDSGRGRWYYRNGNLALDYYDAEETNAGQRFVVYSSGEPDERGRSRPRTVLATFDYLGNGIVFDHSGKIRLKYNQTEGVVLDRSIGPPSNWKWHTLNDPPILQQVMIDTQMPYKDPEILKMGDKKEVLKRPENEEMLAIEFENFLKEKRQKLTQSFKPFQIRMKAMKINEKFSLRVLDQASVYLLFRDGTTNLKINIGMVLDHKEIVDTDTAEIGEVANTLDKLPACTDSIVELQRVVARAQAYERSRVRHESRLKRARLTNSVEEIRAGCSRPLRPPFLSHSSAMSISKTSPSRFKPSYCNVYYNTRLN